MIILAVVILVLLVLILAIGGGNKCLPDYLHKRHDDWIWILSWVTASLFLDETAMDGIAVHTDSIEI